MIGNYLTVRELAEEFRRAVGDSTCEITDKPIISWLNTALRRLAREKGLDALFRYQDTFELAAINKDGSRATSWFLKNPDGARLGTIIDIESMLILDADDCNIKDKELCYLPFEWFRKEYPFPENGDCLTAFTLNEFGGDTKIIFNAPAEGHIVVDMVYTAFHPRITSMDDTVRIPFAFADLLLECLKILMNEESADMATARALYEDWDYLTSQARELIHKRKGTLPMRQVRGSF